jgi:hypothetical protein
MGLPIFSRTVRSSCSFFALSFLLSSAAITMQRSVVSQRLFSVWRKTNCSGAWKKSYAAAMSGSFFR